MSESKTHHAQTPTPTKLAGRANVAFHSLLWLGLALLVVAGILIIVSLNVKGYGIDASLERASLTGAAGSWITWGIPLVVGAVVVAVLGPREPLVK